MLKGRRFESGWSVLRWPKSQGLIAGVLLAILAGAGCGDDDDSNTTPNSEPSMTPGNGDGERTGIAEIDALIDAVAQGDARALADSAVVQDIACSDLPTSLCPGPSAGATARVLPGGVCDDNPVPEDALLDGFAANFLDHVEGAGVHAAWEALAPDDGPPNSVPVGSVRLMWESGSSLVVSRDGEIWYVWYGCGSPSEAFDQIREDAEFLIEPRT